MSTFNQENTDAWAKMVYTGTIKESENTDSHQRPKLG